MMDTETNIYYYIWSKYRPAILQLMKASAKEPQQYKLSAHEFKAGGNKAKSGFTFSLETIGGKPTNSIAGSAIARDLLTVLQQSKTGSLLISEGEYQFRLDREFVLHITRKAEAEQS